MESDLEVLLFLGFFLGDKILGEYTLGLVGWTMRKCMIWVCVIPNIEDRGIHFQWYTLVVVVMGGGILCGTPLHCRRCRKKIVEFH